MNKWKNVKLGDCIEEINERTTENNQYEVLTSSKSGIYSQEEYFDKQVASKDNTGYKIIKKGEFTYRSMSDNGTFTINRLENKEIGIVSPAYPVFRTTNINAEYLRYFFQSDEFSKAIYNLSQGSTRTALKYKDLVNIDIQLPPTEEQEKIVNLLKNIDSIINKYEKLLEEKNQFIKSQFVEMFKDKTKYSKELLGDNVEEMFIGPFGSSLKNECFVNEEKGYCVVYEQKHAIEKFIGEFRYVDEDKYKELKRFEIHPNDIIVSCRGTIGETYIVPADAPLGIMHPSIMKIRVKKDKYNATFFNEVIHNYLNENAGKNNGGTIKMAIKASDLAKTLFIRPKLEEQEKYLKLKQQIDKQKFLLKKQKQNYENLKIGLMQQLLTGKVRVKI